MILGMVLALQLAPAGEPITFESLLREMVDLPLLARKVQPSYRTVQFSSYDRRSESPESKGWFTNSDGFGREPIPGFLETLREKTPERHGLYLVADVQGPGAIVRGWTAGMGGVWTVTLDGSDEPIYEGPAEVFLRDKTSHWLTEAGTPLDLGGAYEQEDSDYLPVSFEKSLRITWEGDLDALHFYHVQVRLYEEGTSVRTFSPQEDLPRNVLLLKSIAKGLLEPRPSMEPTAHRKWTRRIEARSSTVLRESPENGRAITNLAIRLQAEDIESALRGTVMRIAFDGCERPQVEAPVGDFFGCGPGVHPYQSLPITVQLDGTMHCRFVMPFRENVTVAFHNHTNQEVVVEGEARFSDWTWDEESLYFRARWRADHDLITENREPMMDMPYIFLRGSGHLVGAACMISNPSTIPTPGGNWWGEGDEKIFVDDEAFPSTFGTGSEDYFNYSWSRPDLFAFPYCGQPLNSGPGTAGYIANFRYHILDPIPFDRSLAFYMELWQHNSTPNLSYARLCYVYARPGALDDHRALTGKDTVVPALPARTPEAKGQAQRSQLVWAEDLSPRASREGSYGYREEPLAPRGKVGQWHAQEGERLSLDFEVNAEGLYAVNGVMVHSPTAGAFTLTLDGEPLTHRDGHEIVSLHEDYATRVLNVHLKEKRLTSGAHRLELTCTEAGEVAIDYFWIRFLGPAKIITGALEGEGLPIVGTSPGLQWERQIMRGGHWSFDRHLWVKASGEDCWIDLQVPVKKPGRYRVFAHLTRSWDYGILELSVDGKVAVPTLDTFNQGGNFCDVTGPVFVGSYELDEGFVFRLRTVGTHSDSKAPHYYFGLDCLTLVAEESSGDSGP